MGTLISAIGGHLMELARRLLSSHSQHQKALKRQIDTQKMKKPAIYSKPNCNVSKRDK